MPDAVCRFAEEEFVERECLLFEAGSYPDKGVTISTDDLRAIVANSDAQIPVKIEHLAESPFDGALGVVTQLRVLGTQLWGTLRQPVEAWRLAQRAGAKALSVGLDIQARKLVETSFVRHPRIAGAQVFAGAKLTHFLTETPAETPLPAKRAVQKREVRKGAETMSSVRQFAEGLIAYVRSMAGSEEDAGHENNANNGNNENEPAQFAQERAQLAAERTQIQSERVQQQIMEWKRQGRLRATETVAQMAATLLLSGDTALVTFDGQSVPVRTLFARFVQENGPVIPMGEMLAADRFSVGAKGATASARLTDLARDRARKDGVDYRQALALVTADYPELAHAARDE